MDEKEIQKLRKKNDRNVLIKGFWSDFRKPKFRIKHFIGEFIFLFIVLMLAGRIIDLFTFKSKVIGFIFEIVIIATVGGLASVSYNAIYNLVNRKK